MARRLCSGVELGTVSNWSTMNPFQYPHFKQNSLLNLTISCHARWQKIPPNGTRLGWPWPLILSGCVKLVDSQKERLIGRPPARFWHSLRTTIPALLSRWNTAHKNGNFYRGIRDHFRCLLTALSISNIPIFFVRRDYFDVALLVGNLNSHGIIPAFEK